LVQVYPEATVGALIVNERGEVLLVRSHKWGEKYTVPGGHIELGERAEDAIEREVKEETGLDSVAEDLLIVQQAIYPKDYHKHEHYIFLDYVCRAKSTEVKLDGRELQSYIWVQPEAAIKLDLEEYTRLFITKYLEKLRH
jgi:nucleoside triphosphatase